MGSREPAWLEALYTQKFFLGCSVHDNLRKNEKNICCLDCCSSICPHCLPSHRLHRLVQVRRYVYHDVVRLGDIEKLIDCSNVQAYTINSSKVVFIKKRPQSRQFKGSGNYCTSCDRCLQEPYIHCSLGCKVDFVLKRHKDLSPYLRRCKSLRLSPEFLIPPENMEEESTNETAVTDHSTVVDYDNPVTLSSVSSESENTSFACNGKFVVKKRSMRLYICSRSVSTLSHTNISRRKGIPHRSPMC